MESILLAKNKCESKKMWNVNQRKHIHNNLLSKINISHTIKIEKFDHQDWTDFFCIRTYFSLPGWTGSYIFGYLNAKFQPLGSYIIRFLYVGFTVIQKGSSVRGTLPKRRGFNKRRNLDTSSFFYWNWEIFTLIKYSFFLVMSGMTEVQWEFGVKPWELRSRKLTLHLTHGAELILNKINAHFMKSVHFVW